MPNPVGTDRRVDRALADVSIAYRQDAEDALAGNVVPFLPVKRPSDKYMEYVSGTWNKRQARARAPGDPAAEGQYTLSSTAYTCNLYSVKHKDPREDTDAEEEVLDAEIDATEWGTGQTLMELDDQIVTAMMGPSIWDTDVDGTTGSPTVGTDVLQWDQAGSDPITDMVQLNGLVKKASTKWANVGVLGYDVWTILLNHPAITDRIKHTSSDSVRKEILAKLFELDRIVVPGLVENTAEFGQTASMAFIAGAKDVGIFHVPASPGKRVLSAAYIFAYDSGDYTQGHRVSRWFDPDKNSDMTQVDLYVDVKVTATSAGAFIDDAVA